MRAPALLAPGLLALACAGSRGAEAPVPLRSLRIEGGGEDDRRFAEAALGLKAGQPLDEAGFRQALGAVRLVDRYASVEGEFHPDGTARVRLIPLLPLRSWSLGGDPVPKNLAKRLGGGLRKGQRIGPQRLAAVTATAAQLLREAGYPEARVVGDLTDQGERLRLAVSLGAPALVRDVRLVGDPAPYTREQLLAVGGLRPGVTFWTPGALREAHLRLRKRLVKDKRLEGFLRLEQAPEPGVLLLEIRPGPRVNLSATGLSWVGPLLGWPGVGDLVPLARADRYSPSLLDEGAGRITAFYRNQGYPQVQVTYQRRVTEGTEAEPQVVDLTYNIDPGPRRTLSAIRFEGQREISEAELQAAIALPKRFGVLAPHAKAEAIKGLEDRVTSYYLQRGFPEVRVRRKVENLSDGTVEVRMLVREGRRQFLDELQLDLPPALQAQRSDLARGLLLALADRPVPAGPDRFRSDRPHLQGHEGTLEATPSGMRLRVKPSLPLVRNDLALVISDLKQRLTTLGSADPQVKVTIDEEADAPSVRIEIPEQPFDQLRRIVVQGSDATRAQALFRELDPGPGRRLDPAGLDRSQSRIGELGVFQRVDLYSLSDLPDQGRAGWQRGDLALRLQERSPWVFTESFGYDKTQGYHLGFNAQRLNVGGMGRVLDFNVRAGDQTLDIPALRRAFTTGDINRSVDSYSIGYTDPWFAPDWLERVLVPRTRFHLEGAYIEEAQAAFFARRRRFISDLEWKVGGFQSVKLGYRFERVEVTSNTDSDGRPLLKPEELFLLARTPSRSIISAPFLQITVDRRDRPYDPTRGTYFMARLDLANQFFGTSINSSFVKLDLRHQWNWPVGLFAERGVVMANARLGLARPTARTAEDLPLSERFYGGGPYTVRGVEPDMLGEVRRTDGSGNLLPAMIPLGGQVLAVVNLEYRFPLPGMQSVWGEVFVDSGQVYRTLSPESGVVTPFPPLRTTLGLGFILKLGFPLKIEYAADWKRILGRPRSRDEEDTQLKSLLISAGFQF